jgi:hypothetical protein
MSLYLAIYRDEDEIDSVEVGKYSDFNNFREVIANELENKRYGSVYPTLQNHIDSDGEWSVEQSAELRLELLDIKSRLKDKPICQISEKWKLETVKSNGIILENLDDCFFDVDGELLTSRLILLCEKSINEQLPIIFQ